MEGLFPNILCRIPPVVLSLVFAISSHQRVAPFMLCLPNGNHGVLVGIWCRHEVKISYRSLLLSNDFRIIKIFKVIFGNDLTSFHVCSLNFHTENFPGQLFLWSMRDSKLLITSGHKELVLACQLSNVQRRKTEYREGQEDFHQPSSGAGSPFSCSVWNAWSHSGRIY